MKKAFWRSQWGSIDGKQKDTETAREEERLHKLLVPIWVIMRVKMFPGEEVVKQWCVKERQRLETAKATKKQNEATKPQQDNSWRVGGSSSQHSARRAQDCDDDDEDEDEDERHAAAHAATSVFRLAAAGVVLSQTPKRKLRWLVKS